MRQYPVCLAFLGGVAAFAPVSTASAGEWAFGAGCGCAPAVVYPLVEPVVAPPVVVAVPPPAPVRFPYLHGYDFYSRYYYSVGPYGSPVGYRGYYHPYARMAYSGLPGVGSGVVPVGPDYVQARHQPVWRLARPAPAHAPRPLPLRPEDK